MTEHNLTQTSVLKWMFLLKINAKKTEAFTLEIVSDTTEWGTEKLHNTEIVECSTHPKKHVDLSLLV